MTGCLHAPSSLHAPGSLGHDPDNAVSESTFIVCPSPLKPAVDEDDDKGPTARWNPC